jgi:hypothetical protein
MRWAIGLVLIAACHDPAPSPPDAAVPVTSSASVLGAQPPTDAGTDSAVDLAETFANAMSMIEEVAKIVRQNEKDCDVMGVRLDEYNRHHAEFITRTMGVYTSMPPDERALLQRRYHTRFHTAWEQLRPGGLKCKGNEHVRTVALELLGDSSPRD